MLRLETKENIIKDFEREGYVILPKVIPETLIKRLISAGDKNVNSNRLKMRQRSKDGINDGFRNCIALDDSFLELIANPIILPYIIKLLGYDIKLLTSHLIYRKSSEITKEIPRNNPGWHRDFYQAQNSLGHNKMPRLDIKAAFCLTDLSKPLSGGTLFAPKSHLLTKPLELDEKGNPQHYVEPKLKTGDCVLFENRTWHAGGVNFSKQTRKVVMIGYTYVWVQATDFQIQSKKVLEKAYELYGDIGLQLLNGLPIPKEYDFNYNSEPLRKLVIKN